MSALTWQPQEAAVHQIVQLLTEYQNPGANQAQVSYLLACGGWRSN